MSYSMSIPTEALKKKVIINLEEAIHSLTRELLSGSASLELSFNSAIKAAIEICVLLNLSLVDLFKTKMTANEVKYPTETIESDVKTDRYMPKHNELSHLTNYKGDNSIDMTAGNWSKPESASQRVELLLAEETLHEILYRFSEHRNYLKHYNNKGLAMSLLAEFGEVCSALEYAKEGAVSNELANKVSREVADVTIYLFHVARINNIRMRK